MLKILRSNEPYAVRIIAVTVFSGLFVLFVYTV